ncbi:MAG: tRNA (N6-isopentenyl adenosine(37)-C2)-methylthiotransferase MiaB [Rickettsiales bacterium]|nr:tRNA (N6-isopentenyl adenosine(37)-C2)-methylthiotransferase MiaB [Rickettsiales bacterium]
MLSKAKNLCIITYGCQMNVYDSERMVNLVMPLGYKKIDNYHDADLVILNTCHIREKAAEKVYSELGRINVVKQKFKAEGREMLIAVAGCVSQAEGDMMFKRAPFVDFVVGPQSYHNLPELIKRKTKSIKLDFVEEQKFDLLPKHKNSESVSGFLSIQEGCDKFCSFCVVPYTRGAEFSRPVENILIEARSFVDNGTKEITLLGQNVNAYHGVDSKGNTSNLGKLIMELAKIDGLERIRYTTSHPRDMHDDLYEAHASCSKLMPFLHLPVQSGSDKILKLMNRKHDREFYFDVIKKLRLARPDIAFSSDFIIGFPGEEQEDFEMTLDLIDKVKFAQCYSFKYSKRPGTPAAEKQVQVPENIKSERLQAVQKLLSNQQLDFNQKFLGTKLDVLFDRFSPTQRIGRSPYLQSVCVNSDNKELHNKICKVEITNAGPYSLNGKLVA